MIKQAFIAIGTTARELLRAPLALALFNVLYAALLVAFYLFVSTKEATRWQLTLTALAAIAAPLLFFLLQASGADFAQDRTRKPLSLLLRALRDLWKYVLVSLPLIALAVGVAYLLHKLQVHYAVSPEAEAARVAAYSYPQTPPPPPVRWQDISVAALRMLLLGIVLPLVAIHLWLGIAREGLFGMLKRSPRIIARAFTPLSILVYATGLLLFGLMPYFLIFTRTPVRNAWGELLIFGVRLALAFVFTLWGWLITLGALAKILPDPTTEPSVAAPQPADGQTTMQAQESAA